MDAFQEKMDDGQRGEESPGRLLASRIDANQVQMKVMLDGCLEKMEANPGEQKSVAVNEEVPKEKAAVKSF
jgi:hypothetical protein